MQVKSSVASAALDVLKDRQCYEKLEILSQLLAAGLNSAAEAAGIRLTINRIGAIMSCFFTDKPVKNFTDANTAIFREFFVQMLNNGIYLAPSAFEAMFISTEHSKEDVAKTIKAAQNTFRNIADNY